MEAREDQVAHEVGCNCEGTTLVIVHALPTWTCGKCRCKARPTGRVVVLGAGGALPVDWRDQPVVVEAIVA